MSCERAAGPIVSPAVVRPAFAETHDDVLLRAAYSYQYVQNHASDKLHDVHSTNVDDFGLYKFRC